MLRIIQNSNAAGAKSYYSTADYYTQGQELAGVWRGKGAERLGLCGEVQREQWEALCDNRNPMTGDALTARTRRERRVGYDFNFHVPKSVSVAYGLTKDDRILEAFRDSVNATMEDMEAETVTTVTASTTPFTPAIQATRRMTAPALPCRSNPASGRRAIRLSISLIRQRPGAPRAAERNCFG